jgi:AcrR family transcriptional regulator
MAGELTRKRILNAAEKLFAERGITSTSMRALSNAAGVNLAAAHYHFGSKEALLEAVVEHRARPLNAARIHQLEAHLAERGAARPEIESIFRAFLLPALQNVIDAPEANGHLPRLFARVEAQPPELLERIYRKHLGSVARRFVEALQSALPNLPKQVVADRFRLAMGSIYALFSGNCTLDFIPDHPPGEFDLEAKLEQVITFAAGGMRAPFDPRGEEGPL